MNAGWVFFAIFIGIALISAISHVLKNQQQSEPTPRRRTNRRQDSIRVTTDAEQDRFLAEIERLRNKAASAPKAIPTVKPKAQAKKSQRPSLRVEELPVAAVLPTPTTQPKPSSLSAPIVTPESTVAKVATIATIAEIAKPIAAGGTTAGKMTSTGKTVGATSAAPATPFARELAALLKSKRSLPMAVVLQEILGPPKSRRG